MRRTAARDQRDPAAAAHFLPVQTAFRTDSARALRFPAGVPSSKKSEVPKKRGCLVSTARMTDSPCAAVIGERGAMISIVMLPQRIPGPLSRKSAMEFLRRADAGVETAGEASSGSREQSPGPRSCW